MTNQHAQSQAQRTLELSEGIHRVNIPEGFTERTMNRYAARAHATSVSPATFWIVAQPRLAVAVLVVLLIANGLAFQMLIPSNETRGVMNTQSITQSTTQPITQEDSYSLVTEDGNAQTSGEQP